jgi:hypothetical protein
MSWSDAFVLVVVLGWIPPLGFGLLLLLNRERTPFRLVIGCLLLVISLPWLASAIQIPLARSRAYLVQCRSNLKVVGLAMSMYKDDFNGQLPPSLEMVVKYIGKDRYFSCPGSPSTQGAVPYSYSPVQNPKPHVMICWDPAPHTIRHGVFGLFSTKQRNVLCADEHVETMDERDFQSLFAKQTGKSSR